MIVTLLVADGTSNDHLWRKPWFAPFFVLAVLMCLPLVWYGLSAVVSDVQAARRASAMRFDAETKSLADVSRRLESYRFHATREFEAEGFLGRLLDLSQWVARQQKLFEREELDSVLGPWERLAKEADAYNERAQSLWRDVLLRSKADEIISEVPAFASGDRELVWDLVGALTDAHEAIEREFSRRHPHG